MKVRKQPEGRGAHCSPLPPPSVTPDLQGIPNREDMGALLGNSQARTDVGSGSAASPSSCAASGK